VVLKIGDSLGDSLSLEKNLNNRCGGWQYETGEMSQEERLMNRNRLTTVVCLIFALVFAFWTPWTVHAQDSKNPYPGMAPLDQYLMDRDAEIALARSAAPEAISHDATILVLGRHGYETAMQGKNGFVCLVERSWMAPPDNPEFWNPKNRSPICLNPQAVHVVLPIDYKRTELVLAGQSKAQIAEWTKAAYAKGELPALEPGAMSYMMSKGAYLTDQGGHNLAHVMFYAPLTDGANWGADVPNSPVSVLQKGPPEPFTLFIVPVGKWSDGTPAPLPK
jgi:hypothetical protein